MNQVCPDMHTYSVVQTLIGEHISAWSLASLRTHPVRTWLDRNKLAVALTAVPAHAHRRLRVRTVHLNAHVVRVDVIIDTLQCERHLKTIRHQSNL